MLLGYNHNINYKESVFHIQTEDSGTKNPHIVTLLYREGVILCSKKTSYADILIIDNLEAVVEDLMKEQHKDMLRRLKSGEFDAKAFGSPKQSSQPVSEPKAESVEEAPILQQTSAAVTTGINLLFQEAVHGNTEKISNQQKPDPVPSKKQESTSLDDAILNFFGASK